MPGGLFLDVEKAVKEWAWHEYADTENRKQKKLRQKEEINPGMYVGLHIDWSDVKFRDETRWPRLGQENFDENENSNKDKNKSKPQDELDGLKVDDGLRPDHGAIHASVLFNTKFTNNTGEDQDYTMRTDKTTSSTCSTEIENGWCKTWELGINLKTPCEVFEANAGYSREVSLTNTEGQTFEETLSWGVESQIKVKANHIAEAQLVVNEKKYSGDFEVTTVVAGMAYISFTEIRKNNSIVKATGHEMFEIVKWYLDREARKGKRYEFVKVEDDQESVVIKTKGKCQFRFGVKQEVVVHQVKI